MLASTAMNGAVFDTTFNFFVKFKYAKTYDAILATPLGWTTWPSGRWPWALLRGAIYATTFWSPWWSSGWSSRGGRSSPCPPPC
jgi:lipooligosaccharide transport system permease protein